MNCVLYLDNKDNEFNICKPDVCDRYGCRLHPCYSKEAELLDYEFSEMNRWSIWSILLLIHLNLMPLIILWIINTREIHLIIKIISNAIAIIFLIWFNVVIYMEWKYWVAKKQKIREFYSNKIGTTEG